MFMLQYDDIIYYIMFTLEQNWWIERYNSDKIKKSCGLMDG